MKNRILKPHLYKRNCDYVTGEAISIIIKERNVFKSLAEEYIEKYFQLKNKLQFKSPSHAE